MTGKMMAERGPRCDSTLDLPAVRWQEGPRCECWEEAGRWPQCQAEGGDETDVSVISTESTWEPRAGTMSKLRKEAVRGKSKRISGLRISSQTQEEKEAPEEWQS